MEIRARDGVMLWPHPDAEATCVEGHWRVSLGEAGTPVLPCDVRFQHPNEQSEPEPGRLAESLHEVVDHLRSLHAIESPPERAGHIAEHYRRFGPLELCQHGRPVWHDGRPHRGACQQVDPGDVGVVVDFVSQFEAAMTAGHAAMLRRDPPAWVEETLLPLLPERSRKVMAGASQTNAKRRRRMVELAVNQLLRDSAVRPEVLWNVGKGPGFSLVSYSVVGLYASELARNVGRTEPAPNYFCGICGNPVQRKRPPRGDEATYCSSRECKKEKNRINKQRERARKRGEGGQ